MLGDLLLLDAIEWVGRSICPKFNPTSGAPTKPVDLAFGQLLTKQHHGLSDEETVD